MKLVIIIYNKKLLKLNKVKHNRDKIKESIRDHMRKIENEYKYKYNYKYNLIKYINKAKFILNKIEDDLLKRLEDEDKKEEQNKKKVK